MKFFFSRRGRRLKQVLILILSGWLIFSPLAAGATSIDEKKKDGRRALTDQETAGDAAQSGQEQLLPDQLYQARALEGAIDPEEYVLGPADELVLIFQGAEERTVRLEVLPEGTIILPNIGPYRVAGLTLAELKQRIVSLLSRYYKNVSIDCQLSVPRTFLVYVLGEVENPGAVQLIAPFRLSRALAGAGGVGSRGSMRAIEIRKGDTLLKTADMFSFLYLGKSGENVILSEGQTVYVPPRKDAATSVGEIHKPGRYEILPGETVADLIEFSGGITTRGDTTRIIFEQFDDGKMISTREMPFSACAGVELLDEDVVVVPDIMSFPFRSFVQVIGGGGRTGVFYISEGEQLRDFLFRIGRFREMYDLRRGILERRSPEGETTFIYFDPQEVMTGDTAGTIVLEDQDVITIPVVEANVYVIGEVKLPGEVKFSAGMTADRYISLAGGPTDAGSIDRLEVLSIDGESRDADHDSVVYRGETIIVKRKTSKILSSMILGMATITGLLLSVIAITQ